MTGERINRFLDALPRARFGGGMCDAPAFRACGGGMCDAPAFRACGVAGCRLGLVAALGGGLLAGPPLPVVAALCVAAALCGLAPVYLRRLLTGRERLVLLEGAGLALAGGRTGCLPAGCCHGQPSSVGIVRPEEHFRGRARSPFAGGRLFQAAGRQDRADVQGRATEWQISGWKSWEQATKDYDGGGSDDYLEEVEAEYDALKKATAPPATP